jgi:hypothetical protein
MLTLFHVEDYCAYSFFCLRNPHQDILQCQIIKTSDRNHVKRNVIKKLYVIRSQHKKLSEMVINAILKNFSFMIDQNKGNPEGTENWLRAIVEHMYEEHNHCNISWCGFLRQKKL